MTKALFIPKTIGLALLLGVCVGNTSSIFCFNNKKDLVATIRSFENEVTNPVDSKIFNSLLKSIENGQATVATLMLTVKDASEEAKRLVVDKTRKIFGNKVDQKDDNRTLLQLTQKVLMSMKKK